MAESGAKVSVLFVCMGNICRSPTAEGVFRRLVTDAGLGDAVHADSAGTHAYHSGEPPDRRARAAAERRGYSLDEIRARRVTDLDFEGFDFIVAMDEDNLSNLRDFAEEPHHHKIRLFLEFAGRSDMREVPDPYYGGAQGFERVLDLVEEASAGLLEAVRERL
jgi:protein-tyrosine phosphatase